MYFGHIYKIASRRIIGSVQGALQADLTAQLQGDATLGVEAVLAFVDPSACWIDAQNQFVAREGVAANLDKTDIAADGVDVATLSGLPDPCWLEVNGVEIEVTGGSYQVASSSAADIRFGLIGRYSGGPWIVTAHDLAALKTQVQVRIDAASEVCRLKYITPGAGQAMVYRAKAGEAQAYLAAASPANNDYPLLSAEAAATGVTVAALAQSVSVLAGQWLALAAQIEALRIGGKQTVESATTVAAVLAAEAISWP